MKTITVCGKSYKVPTLRFSDVLDLEEAGFSLFAMIRSREPMVNTIALACIAYAMKLDRDEAKEIMLEHFESGGGSTMTELVDVFMDALAESDYFTKAFAQENDVKKGAKARAAIKTTQS